MMDFPGALNDTPEEQRTKRGLTTWHVEIHYCTFFYYYPGAPCRLYYPE